MWKKCLCIIAWSVICIVGGASNAYAIEPDKVKHAEAGAAIGAAVSVIAQDFLLGAALACAAGTAKEFYDMNAPGHTPEFADFAYTCATGTLLAYSLHGFRLGVSGDAPVIGVSLEW